MTQRRKRLLIFAFVVPVLGVVAFALLLAYAFQSATPLPSRSQRLADLGVALLVFGLLSELGFRLVRRP
jgi:hypothetical protein